MKRITDISELDPAKSYTYADYLTWQFDGMVEIIRGKIFKMSPAPAPKHQLVSMSLCREFANYFYKKTCKVFDAPFDVRLSKNRGKENSQIETVVQPDICIICDMTKIDKRGCLGAPELIIEILSDSTSAKDLVIKHSLYEENEVQEYWIVNPDAKSLRRWVLQHGKYIDAAYYDELDQVIENTLFKDLKIKMSDVFED